MVQQLVSLVKSTRSPSFVGIANRRTLHDCSTFIGQTRNSYNKVDTVQVVPVQ